MLDQVYDVLTNILMVYGTGTYLAAVLIAPLGVFYFGRWLVAATYKKASRAILPMLAKEFISC
jgi:hypothetical protein